MLRATSYVSVRAANSSVTESASIACTCCSSMIGRPPTTRSRANAVASSTSRSIAPRHRAAIISRSYRNHAYANPIPSPSAPTMWSAGTRTPSNATTGWWWLIVCEYAGRAHHAHTGGGQVDDEHRVLTGVRRLGELGLEEAVAGAVVRRHVPLDPVEHVLLAVAARGRLDRVDVGAGALLGDRVALVHLAPHRRCQPALALRRRRDLGEPQRRGVDDPARARW